VKEATIYVTFLSPLFSNLPPAIPIAYTRFDFDNLLTLLDILSTEFRAVRFVGGDPLMIPYMFDVLEFAYDKYNTITIETVGAAPMLKYGYAIRSYLNEGANIQILFNMLDPTPQVNDKYLGRGAWELAISGITLLSSTFNINPKVVFYVGEHSTHRYNIIFRLGFDIILRRAYGMKITNRSLLKAYKIAEQISDPERFFVDDPVYRALHFGERWTGEFVVTPDGKVYAHRYLLSTPVADLTKQDLDEALESHKQAIQSMMNRELKGKCAKCAYAEICGGGDPFFWPKKAIYDTACPIEEFKESEVLLPAGEENIENIEPMEEGEIVEDTGDNVAKAESEE